MDVGGAIADEHELPAAIDLREHRIERRVERRAIALVNGTEQCQSRGAEQDAAADAAPERSKVLVPPRPGRRELPLKGPQPGSKHDGQNRTDSLSRENGTIRRLGPLTSASSRRILAADPAFDDDRSLPGRERSLRAASRRARARRRLPRRHRFVHRDGIACRDPDIGARASAYRAVTGPCEHGVTFEVVASAPAWLSGA